MKLQIKIWKNTLDLWKIGEYKYKNQVKQREYMVTRQSSANSFYQDITIKVK